MTAMLRLAAGREPEPSAVILDGRTLRSTPESGGRAGYHGAKRKKGSKPHLALHVTAADADDRTEVERLARTVQAVTAQSVDLA